MPRQPRRQIVEMGTSQAVRLGGPGIRDDPYNWTMEIGWPAFIALVASQFVLINLIFGAIYASIPGAIANAAPGSFLDGFFFSVETLATVGYGNMAPATHLGHAIASLEIMIGLFFSATVTGLVFARFARPRKSMIFSKSAVICDHQGQRVLMVRLALTHARPMASATARLAVIERTTLPDGRAFAGFVELPLLRSQMSMLNLSWTLMHVIDDQSPVMRILESEDPFFMLATVSGLDTLLDRQSFGEGSYRRENVMIDRHFVDIITSRDGIIHMDMARLDEVEPVPSGAEAVA